WIGAGWPWRLVDKAFHVDGVLVGIDAAPRADRHMAVAHDVFDEQVRHAVAKLRIARLFPESLQLAPILAVDDARRIQSSVDRLAAYTNVQPDQVAVPIQPGSEAALRDRPEKVVRLVLLAAPDQLGRHPWNLLGNPPRLVDVILRAAAPAEATAEIGSVGLAFGKRHAGGFRQCGKRGLRVLRWHPHLRLIGGKSDRR